jgi:hypothetical protein
MLSPARKTILVNVIKHGVEYLDKVCTVPTDEVDVFFEFCIFAAEKLAVILAFNLSLSLTTQPRA